MSDYTRKRRTMTPKKSPEELLRAGIVIEIPVNGWSMYPLFVPGRDLAIITPFREALTAPAKGKTLTAPAKENFPSAADVKRGDVVLFRRRQGILVLHRVYKVTKEEYQFVGDNMPRIERGIQRGQLIGKLTGFNRKGREVSTEDPAYRALSRAWLQLRPLRPLIHALNVPLRTVLNGAGGAGNRKQN